ncbi:lecithin-cholesterol acyltransferase-like protein 1 [Cinnamomum micranthum f. kanehirae]|uniref:Lecithin-cholesterol acyltransferase-like protein 1 n=1 Tax=Cinnamomum micranthum f. kanehirae TaxID=337451 RepID=A0A443NHI1_9MAGN|nr:lecithin-cholesterol acyltransferase-like protein 1 [Cinnamomum micranthum f. kanehirae]
MKEEMGLVWVVAMALMLQSCHVWSGSSNLYPVVLVPGSGGNQLEGRLTEAYRPSSLVCRRWDHGRWFRLWFDPSVIVGPLTKCFAERMTLYYDPALDDYRNAPGVETRVPYFGSTQSLLYLDPHLKHITAYMAPLVESLEELGYIDGHNLFGAPYDFRYGLAAEGHPSRVGTQFLNNLKQLVENASSSNGGNPVIIVSHSLGGLFVLHLLNRTTPSWRNKFIKHFIALSAPWGGTVQEMLTFASGYTLGVPLVEPLLVRGEQRSSESNLWLLPSPKLFGRKPLVIAQNRSYSAFDMPEFLEDIGFKEGVYPYKARILPLMDRLIMPEVPVTCIIGSGIKTPETLFYGREGFDKQPDIIYGDGDGTVNMVSLLALESLWSNVTRQPFKVTKIPQVSHTSVLNDDLALREIVREITDINSRVLRSFV